MNSTTGYSPFFVIHGRHCRLPFDSVVGSTTTGQELPEWVRTHLERLGVVYDAVASKLKTHSLNRQRVFDLKRDVHLKFRPGDRVLLLKGKVVDKTITKHEFATEGPYLGPFTVHRALERDNYQLCDLHTRRMHDVVHVERLVPYPSRPAAEVESDSDRYAIRNIVSKRFVKLEHADHKLGLQKGALALQYRVRWLGFSPASDSWRSPHYLGDVKELIDAFEKRKGGVNEELVGQSRDAAFDNSPDSRSQRTPRFRSRGAGGPAPAAEGSRASAQTDLAPEIATREAAQDAPAARRRTRHSMMESETQDAVATAEVRAFTAGLERWLFGV